MTGDEASFVRMDPNLVRALARWDGARQASSEGRQGVMSRAEVLVVIALHALAQGLPRSHRAFGVGECGDPTVEVPLLRSARARILEMLSFARTRERPGVPNDFPGNAWRFLARALSRIPGESAAFEFTTLVSRGAKRNIEHHSFAGPLVAVYEDSVLLRCCVPEQGRYFVLVPTALLRLPVSASGLRLALWLLVRHRGGKSKKHGFRHRWVVKVTTADAVEAGVVASRGARRVLHGAVGELVRAAVVSVERTEPQALTLALSRTFFHED